MWVKEGVRISALLVHRMNKDICILYINIVANSYFKIPTQLRHPSLN